MFGTPSVKDQILNCDGKEVGDYMQMKTKVVYGDF